MLDALFRLTAARHAACISVALRQTLRVAPAPLRSGRREEAAWRELLAGVVRGLVFRRVEDGIGNMEAYAVRCPFGRLERVGEGWQSVRTHAGGVLQELAHGILR